MTLSKQFNLLIINIVLMIFCGTLYITIYNSRTHFIHQLESNAQDTATSLGLSLSDKMNDKATMLSMINVIFDRGYFADIKVINKWQALKKLNITLGQGHYLSSITGLTS